MCQRSRDSSRRIRHVANQLVSQRRPVIVVVHLQDVALQTRHVNSIGAFALARFAGQTKLQDLLHAVAAQSALIQLSRHRQTQCVCPASGGCLLVARGHIAGTHRAFVQFTARAHAIALFDGKLKSALVAIVEQSGYVGRPVLVAVTQMADHRRRIDKFAGIHQILRVEQPLGLPKRFEQLFPERTWDEFSANKPIAVFAGKYAFVLAHHIERMIGDVHHLLAVFRLVQIEHRPEVDHADAGMSVQAGRYVQFVANLLQSFDVLG